MTSRSLAFSQISVASIFAMLLLWVLTTRTAQAANFEVSNPSDTNASGSLRYAINAANSAAGADTISFNLTVPATITLQSQLPAISDSVTLLGPGVANLILSGDEQFSLFTINSTVAVTITDLTLQEGRATNGGAINSQGALTLQRVRLFNNVATQSGGALYSTAPTLAIISSEIYSNVAHAGAGGGVYISNMGDIAPTTLTSAIIHKNQAGHEGGGIYLHAGNLALKQTDLYSNSAEYGGALYLSALTRLDASGGEISHNRASDDGGGLYVAGTAYLTATKFLSNDAFDKGGAILQVGSGATQANHGCFVGNSNTAVGTFGGISPLVAWNNWWGLPNGPGGEGSGWGDWVSAEVDFSNFKSAAPVGCPDLTPHLSMVKRVEGIPAPSDAVTYTLVISNSGIGGNLDLAGDLALDLVVTDTLPAKINFVSWREEPTGASQANDQITFNGPITVGQVITVSFITRFVGNHSDEVTNTAFYSSTFDSGWARGTFTATHLLSVTTTGSGNGTVSSKPAGIICGNNCSDDYPPGTVVTLTATPNASSTFTRWGGACTGTGTCVVTMGGAKQVTATFAIKGYTLSVAKGDTGSGFITSLPSGINCGSDCNNIYPHATVVTLTAAANAGSTFIGWKGACGEASACAVTMNGAKQVTATFALDLETDITNLGASNDGPTLMGSPTQFSASATGNNIRYTWGFGDSTIGSGAIISHTYALPGEYRAEVTAQNGTDSESAVTIVTVTAADKFFPPYAINDATATIENMPLSGNALDNDEDPQASVLAMAEFSQPAHGMVTLAANGDFTYTPQTGYVGLDSFEYTVSNSHNLTDTAMVVIAVEAAEISADRPTVILTTPGVTTTQRITDGAFALSLQVPAAVYSGTLSAQDILFLVYTPLVTSTANLDFVPSSFHFGSLIFSLQAHLSNTVLNAYRFDPPLLIEIVYPPSSIEGLNPEAFTLRYWNHETSTWATDGVQLLAHDRTGRKLIFALYHLTDFALFQDQAKMLFMPALFD